MILLAHTQMYKHIVNLCQINLFVLANVFNLEDGLERLDSFFVCHLADSLIQSDLQEQLELNAFAQGHIDRIFT